jgi:hypothetical protein
VSDRYGISSRSTSGIVASAELENGEPMIASESPFSSLKASTAWSGMLLSSRTVSLSWRPPMPPLALICSTARATDFWFSVPSGE